MFRVMRGLEPVEWGMQKEVQTDINFQTDEEQAGKRKTKQKTLLDYASN